MKLEKESDPKKHRCGFLLGAMNAAFCFFITYITITPSTVAYGSYQMIQLELSSAQRRL